MTKYKVNFEHHKTLDALNAKLGERPENTVFKGRELSSDAKGREYSTGTTDYAHAIEIMEKGYKEPLAQLKKGITKTLELANIQRKRPTRALAGYKPSVPSYLAGHPMSMITKKNTPAKAKLVHLIYGFTASANVDKDDLIKAGILFLSLVNHLELEGYRVKIDVLFVAIAGQNGKEINGFTVNVKEYAQPLNLLKLCYPLVHPSFMRRTCFKWTETFPPLKASYYAGTYGTPLYHLFRDKEIDLLKEHGAVPAGAYYANTYHCFKECQTVDELKKKIGLK
jgi:hypothetical protein